MDCRHMAGQRQQRGDPLNPRNWRATHVSAIHLLAIRIRDPAVGVRCKRGLTNLWYTEAIPAPEVEQP